MEMRKLALLTAVIAIWSGPAFAADVGALTTFTAGTPAVASEVNGNFDAVATAVNSKQNNVTGTCAAGTAMSQIHDDGSVSCTGLTAGGAASVSGHALISTSFNGPGFCRVNGAGNPSPWVFFTGDPGQVLMSGGCTAAGTISLPHGTTLTGLSCRLSDGYDNGSISVSLVRSGMAANSGGSLIFTLPATTDDLEQTLTDTSAAGGTDVVNNADFVYYLAVSFDLDSPDQFFDIEDDLMIAGCSVTYTAD
jgi:hypothetical protein